MVEVIFVLQVKMYSFDLKLSNKVKTPSDTDLWVKNTFSSKFDRFTENNFTVVVETTV